MTNIIDVKNIKFKYHEEQESYTLNDISFHVKRGEWLSIIGHNGSGKSTSVRLLNGLIQPESGDIFVDNELLTDENVWEIRQKIGMVFQNPDNQFVGSTVEDDVAFGLENKGVPHQEMSHIVEDALAKVGMFAFKEREPSRLSGGQKQRVAIAGAIAMRPKIIVLDEATSMLDPKGRLELIKTIKSIREEYDLTVISITHDLDEVALSDRVIVMKNGQIESSSTPTELFERGEELIHLGLDIPFSSTVINMLKNQDFNFSSNYLSEEELIEQLWQSIFKM